MTAAIVLKPGPGMRVLFLDDDAERHTACARDYRDLDVTHVWTAAGAVAALEMGEPFDVACLDHDLGGQHFATSDEGSGYAVAAHIARMEPGRRPREVVVHSWNPEGAARMVATLIEAGVRVARIPFGYPFMIVRHSAEGGASR